MVVFVVRNHNGTEICRGTDLGNVMEEGLFYEEVTGNRITVDKEYV